MTWGAEMGYRGFAYARLEDTLSFPFGGHPRCARKEMSVRRRDGMVQATHPVCTRHTLLFFSYSYRHIRCFCLQR